MSDYIIITLLTLAVYYPLTLGVLALMILFAWRQRKSPYWRLGLVLLTALFVLFAMAAYDWYHYTRYLSSCSVVTCLQGPSMVLALSGPLIARSNLFPTDLSLTPVTYSSKRLGMSELGA
ncbi:Uncharacterised protein [Serratia quinivorans]|nr:Uncharacterised protein [Serratia quinivorans]CAI0767906.1 Uncharacterised protein [Serratia quinivorans]CAI1675566.1 Uncharacterised protein [Serratia quinivorans]CAI2053186.1 Uncharacterised protein [Serratia quinivorans]CAI2100964.1 Uncharacterised protein [Serratia quinivorans]